MAAVVGSGRLLRIVDKDLQKYIPKMATHESLKFIHGRKPRFSSNPRMFVKMVSRPAWNLLERGGKRARAVFFLLLTDALGGSLRELSEFAVIPEIMHNASLIIDDIEDESESRRNAPSIHRMFGTDVAINAAGIMAGLSGLTLLRASSKPDFDKEMLLAAYEVNAQAGIDIGIGQAIDIYLRRIDPKLVREEDYLQSCAYKTGALLKLAAQLSAILCRRTTTGSVARFGDFGEILGACFQIRDDVLNFKGFAGREKGDIGGDVIEGKITLPVIHALKHSPRKDELYEILCKRKRGRKDALAATRIIRDSGALDYASGKAKTLLDAAWNEISGALPDSDKKLVFRDYCYYLAIGREN